MAQHQLDKERIRLTREIASLENQLAAATKGKEEKLDENKQIREEIAKLEEENKGLEDETRRLDEEIAGLDDEFKTAQIEAGRLRREIKINIERAENERKQSVGLRSNIVKLENTLESLRREIKTEIDDRRTLEARLRKTNAHIDSMKEHWAARFATKNLEKQEWFLRQEEPVIEYEELIEEEEKPEVVTAQSDAPEEKPEETKKESDDGGIDFGMD